MAHQCDCDFEAGKRECEVFFYNTVVKDTLLCTLV